MHIFKKSAAYIRLLDPNTEELSLLKAALAYKNTSTEYLYSNARKNKFQYNRDPERWHAHVLDLKSKINQTALLQDSEGYYTYAGLLSKLKQLKLVDSFDNQVDYPEFNHFAYSLNYTPLTPYPYQTEAVEKLLANPHASIEISTGGGKSNILESLCKNTGLRTVIMVPFVSIAKQMYDQFVEAFGKKYVGLYGDGKKQCDKKFVIAIAASLARLEPDNPDYKEFASRDVLIVDESHLIGAPTLSEVLLTLCKDVPYRWSVSATQLRGDGGETLLNGLIGDILVRKDYKELCAQGYLAPLKFRVFNVFSNSKYSGTNPLKTKQEHYLYNPQIIQLAAEIANMRAKLNESVLILIDEFEQVDMLKGHLRVPYEVASSQSDVGDQVVRFNKKEIPLLIGTSALATGSNLKPTETLILLTSGKSEIKTKQSIGRATRLFPGKKFCSVIDFNVQGVNQLERHFNERLDFYKQMTDDIIFLDADDN